MVRPKGSFLNRQLALEFAETVTEPHPSKTSKVARGGQYSLFAVFAKCCPWAVREFDGGSREGLTYQEFNKLLEGHDFLKLRKSPPAPGSDPSENFADPNNPGYTGAYAFAKLRWRDPFDAEDCAELMEGRRTMQVMFCGENQIVDEVQFLSILLEAKSEGDRQAHMSERSTPRSGSPVEHGEATAHKEAKRRWFEDSDDEDECPLDRFKRQRTLPASSSSACAMLEQATCNGGQARELSALVMQNALHNALLKSLPPSQMHFSQPAPAPFLPHMLSQPPGY